VQLSTNFSVFIKSNKQLWERPAMSKMWFLLIPLLILTGSSYFPACEEVVKVKDDVTAPVIVAAPIAEVTDSTATISWTTDEPCSVSVKYVIHGATDTAATPGKEYRQHHQVRLVGLIADSDYDYYTVSFDVSGNFTLTDWQTFHTAIDTGAFLQLGWQLLKEKNYYGAKSAFRNYLTYYPASVSALTGLGWCLLRTDSISAAQSNFLAALDSEPLQAEALSGMAWLTFRASQWTGLQAHLEKLLASDSLYIFPGDTSYNYRDLRLMLANAYNRLDMSAEAQAQLDLIYPQNGLNPDDSTTWKVNDPPYVWEYATYEEALNGLIEYLNWLFWNNSLPKPAAGDRRRNYPAYR